MLAFLLLALAQGEAWSTAPTDPTVGDTIWIERVLPAPAGWRVRAGRLSQGESYEPLADPVVLRRPAGWLVRYAVVAWTPGTVRVALPPLWRLGPGGEADSVPGGELALDVRSVIPDSVTAPQPQPALAPSWPAVRRPVPPLVASLAAVLALAGAIAWRRRGPRALPEPAAAPAPAAAIDDERWLEAGEPRAVAARAAAELRAALAQVAPAAHVALSTFEALAAAAPELHQAEHRELAAVLTALDQVGYAAVHGAAVGELAQRARRLARELRP
jgi:hypothetical protein